MIANPTKLDDPAATRTQVCEALARAGLVDVAWYETTAQDPGRGQTAKAVADGADLVLALGGDGTVRACAAQLSGSDVPLALLPAGTGNLLARNLGIPADLEAAAQVAAAGARRRIDLVDLDDETFAVMGGCGFDARLFELTSEDLKAHVGWAAYLVAGARAVRSARPVQVDLVVDGSWRRLRAVGVVVGNVGMLTGGVQLLPDAVPDDGRLDVAVLTPVRARDWVGLGVRLLARRRPHPYQLTAMTAERVELRWAHEVPVEVDGDLVQPRRQARFVGPARCVDGVRAGRLSRAGVAGRARAGRPGRRACGTAGPPTAARCGRRARARADAPGRVAAGPAGRRRTSPAAPRRARRTPRTPPRGRAGRRRRRRRGRGARATAAAAGRGRTPARRRRARPGRAARAGRARASSTAIDSSLSCVHDRRLRLSEPIIAQTSSMTTTLAWT